MSGGNVIHVTNDNKWVILLSFHSFFTTCGVKLSLPPLSQKSKRRDTSFLLTWCVIFIPTQDQLRTFDGALPHVCPDPGPDGSLHTGLQVHRATWLVTDVFRSRASETHFWRQCRYGSRRLEVKLMASGRGGGGIGVWRQGSGSRSLSLKGAKSKIAEMVN